MMKNVLYRLNRLRGIRLERLELCVRRCAKRSDRRGIDIFFDMCLCYLLFGAVYSDYLLFGFDTLSFQQKKNYMTRSRFHRLAVWANPPSACEFVGSKYGFYQKYREYMARSMVPSDASDTELVSFLEKNPVFFIKPDTGTSAEGVRRVCRKDYRSDTELKDYIRSQKGCVLEEPIYQHSLMSRFNPDSVNTLRIVYLTKDAKTHFLYCSLRVGRKGSCVDNLCAGGMICAVNTQLCRVCSDAFDNDGNCYPTHPDGADAPFNSMTVPYVDEALTLSHAVAQRLYRETGLRLVGFDVAVTPKGPIILEANAYPTHYGWQRPGFTDEHIPTGIWKQVKNIMDGNEP